MEGGGVTKRYDREVFSLFLIRGACGVVKGEGTLVCLHLEISIKFVYAD